MKTVTFSPQALQQLDEWRISNPKLLAKIVSLVIECVASPFTGKGKPEPLKHDYKGSWSRRIDQEHRLVYEVRDDTIWIISCRYHYE